MASAGIRELKDHLSRYIRLTESGKRVAITAHGRIVAELVPPRTDRANVEQSGLERLVAEGLVRPPSESGDPTEGWPNLRLPAGTAASLIDEDRGEA